MGGSHGFLINTGPQNIAKKERKKEGGVKEHIIAISQ
jgi:hypothetical protein